MAKIYLLLGFFWMQISFAQKDIFTVARSGSLQEIEILYKENPELINKSNENGYSPLILASYRANIPVVKFLIEKGADINQNSDMGTALMAAAVKKNTEIAQLLLEKKADPNLSDPNGTTALIYAVQFNAPDLIKLLLKYNASKNGKDKSGKTAFEYAVFAGNEAIINLLK